MIADMHDKKILNKIVTDLFIKAKIILFFLSCNQIIKYQKMLDKTLRIVYCESSK